MPLPVEIWLFKDAPRVGVRATLPLKVPDAQGRPAKYISARGAGVDAALTTLATKIAADVDIQPPPQVDDLDVPPPPRPA